MGFLDKLLGREPLQQQRPQQASGQWGQPPAPAPAAVCRPAAAGGASTEDERAIARYTYLLRTAPPEDIEKVHTEAFAQAHARAAPDGAPAPQRGPPGESSGRAATSRPTSPAARPAPR